MAGGFSRAAVELLQKQLHGWPTTNTGIVSDDVPSGDYRINSSVDDLSFPNAWPVKLYLGLSKTKVTELVSQITGIVSLSLNEVVGGGYSRRVLNTSRSAGADYDDWGMANKGSNSCDMEFPEPSHITEWVTTDPNPPQRADAELQGKGAIWNDHPITFDVATDDWADGDPILGYFICSEISTAVSKDNLIWYGDLSGSGQTVSENTIAVFPEETIILTCYPG